MAFNDPWTNKIELQLCDAQSVMGQVAAGHPHYVYVLARPNGTPFYVGKGTRNRVTQHEADARTTEQLSHKLNVIRSIVRQGEAIRYCIESFHVGEADALARERELIRLFGRHDLGTGPLTNQTDGGEGASNPSEESRERRRQNLWGEDAADEGRRAANRFFQQVCAVESVPIKPLAAYKPERLFANRDKFAMSRRQAAALAASAIANRVMLGAGAIIPRQLTLEGIPMVIENGAGRDMLSSGIAELATGEVGQETLMITRAGYRYLVATLDQSLLVAAGVLQPE